MSKHGRGRGGTHNHFIMIKTADTYQVFPQMELLNKSKIFNQGPHNLAMEDTLVLTPYYMTFDYIPSTHVLVSLCHF